jgi:hypothetical protein
MSDVHGYQNIRGYPDIRGYGYGFLKRSTDTDMNIKSADLSAYPCPSISLKIYNLFSKNLTFHEKFNKKIFLLYIRFFASFKMPEFSVITANYFEKKTI